MAIPPVPLPEHLGIINDSAVSLIAHNNMSENLVKSSFKIFAEANHSFLIQSTICCLI
jgi:hypothetical protein